MAFSQILRAPFIRSNAVATNAYDTKSPRPGPDALAPDLPNPLRGGHSISRTGDRPQASEKPALPSLDSPRQGQITRFVMNRKSVPFERVCFCERNVIPVLRAACCNAEAHAPRRRLALCFHDALPADFLGIRQIPRHKQRQTQ